MLPVVFILFITAVPTAFAHRVNVFARIYSEDNLDCSATYTGTHTLQVLDIQSGETGVVGIQGRLWRYPNNPLQIKIVSQCLAGGELPQTNFAVCITRYTHPCINPQGPRFRAYSGSGVKTDWSDLHRIVCLDITHEP